MPKQCQDNYSTQFSLLPEMQAYHENLRRSSRWERTSVKSLEVAPLDKTAPLFSDRTGFDAAVSEDAIADTAANLGLAVKVDGCWFPPAGHRLPEPSGPRQDQRRRPAQAQPGGTGLCAQLLPHPPQGRHAVADPGREGFRCPLRRRQGLLRPGDRPASREPSGQDGRALPRQCVYRRLQRPFHLQRFLVPAGAEAELLDTCAKLLTAYGSGTAAAKRTPGIRFSTSNTSMASAKVSALLLGLQYPIHIGGMVAVDHRGQAKMPYFTDSLDMLFAQFGNSIARLSRLLKVHLDYPVNAMTAVCKKLALPKKAALEAISMFEAVTGEEPASAHDGFMAMQEIPFIMKTNGTPEAKLLALQESMARALTLRWTDYDYTKKVGW